MQMKTKTINKGSGEEAVASVRESVLELVHAEDGSLKLQDMDGKEEPLVSIKFSEKAQAMLGADVPIIGQHMIHSAMQVIMQQQMSHYHAHVHDSEPKYYS